MTVHHDTARWDRDLQARAEGEEWRQGMILSRHGDIRPIELNIGLALQQHPDLRGRLRLNGLSGMTEGAGLPWQEGGGWRAWTDTDDLFLTAWCQDRGIMAKPPVCAAAARMVASRHPHHPVRSHLDGLTWDGVPRLDTWLVTYLGAKVEPGRQGYLREVGRKVLVQAVARVHEPGCQADHTLILQGPQGTGKSSAVATLSPDPDWCCDEVADLGSKDSAQDLMGKWLIELAELSAMKRGEVERVKAFISRRRDHYRPSYGRHSQDFPRQCVFFGTTNADAYLGDETGNRRFWPVSVGLIDLDALRRDRDQLWAEAVAAYKAGERWHLAREVEKLAAEEQTARRVVDTWEEWLLTWAGGRLQPFTMGEALAEALNVPVERQDRAAQMRVAAALKANGYERRQKRQGSVICWVYVRTGPPFGGGGPGGVGYTPEVVGDGPQGPDRISEAGDVGDVGDVGDKKAKRNQPCNQPNQPNQPIEGKDLRERIGVADGGWLVGEVGYRPPPWDDSGAWLARLRPLKGDTEACRAEVLVWAEAAGCGSVPDPARGGLTLIMPPGMPSCPARFALLKQARDAGLRVEELEGASP